MGDLCENVTADGYNELSARAREILTEMALLSSHTDVPWWPDEAHAYACVCGKCEECQEVRAYAEGEEEAFDNLMQEQEGRER